eukprot:scaffold56013_cov67-Phaeocystis_antarctica.AAC.4
MTCWPAATKASACLGCGPNRLNTLGLPVIGPHRPQQLSQQPTRFEQQQQGNGRLSNGMITTCFDSQQQQQVNHLELRLVAVEQAAARERGTFARLGIRRAVVVLDRHVVLDLAAARAAIVDAVGVVFLNRAVVTDVEVRTSVVPPRASQRQAEMVATPRALQLPVGNADHCWRR